MNKIDDITDLKIQNLIQKLIQKLTLLFNDNLSKIFLFGSYARNGYNNLSDIDIMIVIKSQDCKKFEDKILDLTVDLSIEFDVVLSLFLENEADFQRMKAIKPLYRNIENEGIYLYAA